MKGDPLYRLLRQAIKNPKRERRERMKKKKLVALLLGSLTVFALAGVATGCRDKNDDENKNSGSNTETPVVDKDINYKPGDVIVDEKDVEFTETDRETGYSIKYTDKQIDVKYLAGNASYITLSGKDRTQMKVTGYSGDLTELSLTEIEKKVKVNDAPISVSEIAEGAFANCATLEKADLSKQNSALAFEIGDGAFYNCTKLSSVTFPDKVYVEYNTVGNQAFYNNISLKEVALGEKFTVFGAGVFENCTTLASVTLPTKLTSISTRLFSGCESLQSITLPAGVKSIENSAFKDTALTSVPFETVKELRYIGASAFENTKITTLKVPDSVTTIDDKAFYDCANLTSVTVPFIGKDVAHDDQFANRYGMSPVTTLPDNPSDDEEEGDNQQTAVARRSVTVVVTGAKTIPAYAFNGCDDVKSIQVTFTRGGKYKVYHVDGETFTTETVTISQTMGDRAFYGCSSLTSVTLPKVDAIPTGAFRGCEKLATVNIPDIKLIGDNAFYGCKALTGYTVPDTVTSIGSNAFYGCKALSSINIPSAVKSIGSRAFANSGLTSFALKYNQRSAYGSAMLADCTKLQSLTIDKYDGYVTEQIGGMPQYTYRTLGSLNSLFSSNYDAEYEKYETFEDNFPFYVRFDGSSSVWLPKTLTKVTVESICQVPSNFAQNVTSLTEISLGFVESVSANDYSDNNNYKYANIQSNAFQNCSSLATVTVTNGNYVTGIGSEAFSGCAKLPDSVLTSFNKVKTIGYKAFSGCTSFRNVTVPASVWNNSSSSGNGLGSNVFHNCYGITSLTVEQYSYRYSGNTYSLEAISNMFGATRGNNELSSTFNSRYPYANNTVSDSNRVPATLKTVTLNKVISLGTTSLRGIQSVEEVKVNFVENNSDYAIRSEAFSGCYGLKKVTTDTPDVKVSFDAYVFTSCYQLETVEIPVPIETSNTNGIFSGMSYTDPDDYSYNNTHEPKLKEITLMMPENLSSYYLGRLFYGSPSTTNNSYVYDSLRTVHLIATPTGNFDDDGNEIEGTFRIPSYMFSGCENLTAVTFGSEVTSIGESAFANTNLGSVPDGTTVRTYRNWVLGRNNSSSAYIVPANAVGIADSALGTGSNPTVYFRGNAAAWEEVKLPSTYSNAKVLYYSLNEPTSYGPHWKLDNNAPVAWNYGTDTDEYTLNANGGYFNGDETTTEFVIPSTNKGTSTKPSYELHESELATPTRDGYYFDGWYTDAACTKEASFPYYVRETANTPRILYAKWVTYQITTNSYVTEEDGVYTITPTSYSSSDDGYIEISVKASVTITFEYKLSGNYSDRLYVYKNGDYNSSNYLDYGSASWTDCSYSLDAGETIRIRYHINSYSPSYPSNAQIRNLTVTPVADAE